MSYKSQYKTFIFESFVFDHDEKTLHVKYSFDDERYFEEKVEFYGDIAQYDHDLIERIAFYYFIVAGSSYYKTFLAPSFEIRQGALNEDQAAFFNMLYHGGLSQYIYENNLHPDDIARFSASQNDIQQPLSYEGKGILLMESGGKDSILSAELLKEQNTPFTSWHMSSSGHYPKRVFEQIGAPHLLTKRSIDIKALTQAREDGAMNGHVPFSAITAGAALMHAALTGKKYVIASNEASADEGNVEVDGYVVNHQFSKTYKVELLLQDYVHRYVTPGLQYVSLLRPFTEVKVAELFAKYGWEKYKDHYSSCNLANYKQNEDDGKLTWDGTCPKCVNTFLLFAPFVPEDELLSLFGGKNLMADESLREIFRQLLGVSDVKPFECVATFDEMQYCYQRARDKSKTFTLAGIEPAVPAAFDYKALSPYQPIVDEFISVKEL